MKLEELKRRLFKDPKVKAMYNIGELYREARWVSQRHPKSFTLEMMDTQTDVYVDHLWEQIAEEAKALTTEEYESLMEDLYYEEARLKKLFEEYPPEEATCIS